MSHQDAVRDLCHEACQESGQEHKEPDGEAHSHHDREPDDQFLHSLIAQLLIQPLLKFRGLPHILLGVVVGREHEGLDALDHAVQECDAPADEGQSQDRVAVPDELEGLLLDDQALGPPDDDTLLFRAPHKDALDEGLSADGGAKAL